MVAHLHDAGLEVILDVVYNHTAEGNELGPNLSFRGIDNDSYYRLLPDKKRRYINDTGTGNTLNLSNSRVVQMVADSLRYWVQEMHVDGFRFDLGTILAREWHGFDQGSGFLHVCQQDPALNGVKLIAEPWDLGPGGYQVGGFPPGWAEWNDRFRDDVRAFWRGDEGRIPGARRPPLRLGRHVQQARPQALGQPSTSSPPMTASPCATSSATTASTTRPTARTTATATTTTTAGTTASKARPTTPTIRAVRQPPDAQHAGHAAALAGHADAARRRRVRPHPGRQQQRLLPGQRDQLDRLGRPGMGPANRPSWSAA